MKRPIQNILIIGKVWPEPGSSAAGSRMMQLIGLFIEEGWGVTFASAAGASEFAADLESTGVKTVSVEMNCSSFDGFIKELNPDVVLFDRFMTEEQFGWRVAGQCPDALRVLDTEDLHCLRQARQRAWNSDIEFEPQMLFEENIALREIASIYRCDMSLIISETEIELLNDSFNISSDLLHYIPFLHDPVSKEQMEWLPGFEERSGFISIGNFLHEPNWNAVLWLKEEIWPGIRDRLPDAELHIYGAYPTQKVYQLHEPGDGFIIKGRAENANYVIRKARVLLAPLRFGAGLKGKLVDAMMNGTPSVSTPVGAEGIAKRNDWCGMIQESADLIAEDAAKLYLDIDLWEKCRDTGFRIFNEKFNKALYGDKFIVLLYDLKSSLTRHRRNNFTGAMLMHHTIASTKYMAKWIEAKNR